MSSPTLCPSGDQELLDELCGSGEDSQVAKAAFHSQWQQGGCSSTAAPGCSGCVGMDPERSRGDGDAEAAAEGAVQCPGRALLRLPGPRRAGEELSCPSLHKQRPPAPPRCRGELAPLGEPLIGTWISGRFPSAPLSPDPVTALPYSDALGGVWIN